MNQCRHITGNKTSGKQHSKYPVGRMRMEEDRQLVDLKDVPQSIVDALISTEDSQYAHSSNRSYLIIKKYKTGQSILIYLFIYQLT
jgi:hypothetical protein